MWFQNIHLRHQLKQPRIRLRIERVHGFFVPGTAVSFMLILWKKWILGGGFEYFFIFTPYLGRWSNLTNIFQMGWFNHQPEFDFHTHTHTPQTNRFNPPRSSRNSLIIFRAYENHCLPWLNPWDLTLGTPWDFRMPKFPRMTWKKHESGPCFQWSFFGTVRDFFSVIKNSHLKLFLLKRSWFQHNG